MKQVILSYRTGALTVADVPMPTVRSGTLLVRNVRSIVSAGTEKLVTDLAKKNLIGKALARPDQVKRVISKARTDGILEAYQQAANRLDTPVPLGYSSAGEVIAVGSGVTEFHVGDRVACAGQGYASHAEVVCMPKNLCVRIPEGSGGPGRAVDFESAAFVMLGAIALHGVHMAQPTLGERVVVLGLGLLGQITVQILRAAGCHVFGVDLVPQKVSVAQELGAEGGGVIGQDDITAAVVEFTRGAGADAVLILASTSSNQPIEMAGEICRGRGRIVAVGAVPLDIPRNLFYEKELSVTVSRSSGPGIYDPQYKQKGLDYPLPYVRWTQRRNMVEFLDLVARDQVNLASLITHRFPIERATEAYDLLSGKAEESYIGVLLKYSTTDHHPHATIETQRRIDLRLADQTTRLAGPADSSAGTVSVGLIGAGLFVGTTLLPTLKKISGAHLRGVATATGTSAQHVGKKFGFDYCATDYRELLGDPEIDCIFIATRHNLHAALVVEALQAGKHVFVEKPLALNLEQLQEIVEVFEKIQRGQELKSLLMVGFNRRFSPFTQWVRQRLTRLSGPLLINCRVNAGSIPKDSWVNDPEEGGGRIIGEVCHFVDLVQYVAGALPIQVYAAPLRPCEEHSHETEDLVAIIHMGGGSVASIAYTAKGDRSFPRERIEIFKDNSVCVIDNFKSARFTHRGRTQVKRHLLSVDRGYRGEFAAWFNAIRHRGPSPVDFFQYVSTTLTTFEILESLRTGSPKEITLSSVLPKGRQAYEDLIDY